MGRGSPAIWVQSQNTHTHVEMHPVIHVVLKSPRKDGLFQKMALSKTTRVWGKSLPPATL